MLFIKKRGVGTLQVIRNVSLTWLPWRVASSPLTRTFQNSWGFRRGPFSFEALMLALSRAQTLNLFGLTWVRSNFSSFNELRLLIGPLLTGYVTRFPLLLSADRRVARSSESGVQRDKMSSSFFQVSNYDYLMLKSFSFLLLIPAYAAACFCSITRALVLSINWSSWRSWKMSTYIVHNSHSFMWIGLCH